MSDPPAPKRRLRSSGGYRRLRAFRAATVIYDGTVSFCDRFVDKRSRTHDQMVQAARSGRQNIAEGSRAAGTSTQSELKLIGVARASLDELLLDFEDFLRQRRLPQWGKGDPEALAVRAIVKSLPEDQQADDRKRVAAYSKWLDPPQPDPVAMANTIICLIHQANFLLDQQLEALEQDFIENGGYSEALATARIAVREKTRGVAAPDPAAPSCPACGKPMVVRTARKGKAPGTQFWGCSGFPDCRELTPL